MRNALRILVSIQSKTPGTLIIMHIAGVFNLGYCYLVLTDLAADQFE